MPDIYHEILIIAAADKVYDAITTKDGLAAWWTPRADAKAETDSIATFPFGEGYFKEMKITGLIPSEQVKWTCIKGAEEWMGTHLSFKLEDGDQQTLSNSHPEIEGQIQQQASGQTATLLIFHHDDWKDYTPMFAECNYTWAQFLRSLKLFCETGKGRPWPYQHRIDQ